eukprot:CAMPEP_0185773806 /NCGR_PEP_ID=MMETSP1174-20130828/75160_1 /TAXON_ID=35687 /ORGANISM="Dictyocha speculum, Strain CCMP1381" /LENGTH=73 /DNA_ID=CAMNT_0028460651 /DNA_START=1 /DNA_END=219 /DNA_ORIENTATION=+
MDSFGFVYWVDRASDNFRWKGENISTAEVALALCTVEDAFADVSVYGVAVPGHEGHTGMASVALNRIQCSGVT